MAVTASVLGSLPGANSKDKSERIPAAVNALNRALAGDTSVLAYMVQQSQHSATAVGKTAFSRALDYYNAHKPAAPTVTTAPTPQAPRPPVTPVQQPKPLPVPSVTAPGAQPAPIGFNPGEVLVDPAVAGGLVKAPFASPGIEIHGTAPGIITPVRIGRPVLTHTKPFVAPETGSVVSGPPQDDSVSVSTNKTPAAPDFGYVAPTPTPIAAPTAEPPATSGKGMLIAAVLVVGVLLFGFIDGNRKK
ncbi:MAG TPA: hypothetical protein VKA60_27575 [Blastocatellia bacterium]|nr:hypothetical protein [Blastocatellia bacterium]